MSTALPSTTPHQIRDELTEIVIKDLLGPAGGPDEELSQHENRVRERYLVGMLAPNSTRVAAEEIDDLGTSETDDPEVGPTDSATPPTDTFFPNSMGISFVVDSDARAILLKTEWGRYRRQKSAIQKRRDGADANVWKRTPMVGDPVTLPLKKGSFGPIQPRPDTDHYVVLQGKMRQTANGWVVTIFFINTPWLGLLDARSKTTDEPHYLTTGIGGEEAAKRRAIAQALQQHLVISSL